jgi:hypothetical protein
VVPAGPPSPLSRAVQLRQHAVAAAAGAAAPTLPFRDYSASPGAAGQLSPEGSELTPPPSGAGPGRASSQQLVGGVREALDGARAALDFSDGPRPRRARSHADSSASPPNPHQISGHSDRIASLTAEPNPGCV